MKTFLLVFLSFGVLSLTACNTVEGVGQDVKATGRAVEKAANDSKPN
jgi:predicted small secreted protein